MGINNTLQEVVDAQLQSLKSNLRTFNDDILILVNFMPVMGIMQPYQLITEELKDMYVKNGYPKPVDTIKGKILNEVPYIKRAPAYAYYVFPDSKKPIFNYTKNNTSPRCVFKPSPNAYTYPALIKVKDNFYYNPNFKLLKTVISDYYAISDMAVYCGIQDSQWVKPMSATSGTSEISYYNYMTQSFNNLLTLRGSLEDMYSTNTFITSLTSNGLTPKQLYRAFETHLFRAQVELGHYFCTFRHKRADNKDLSYCYNDEFVPIYYGMNVPSYLNDSFNMVEYTDAFNGNHMTVAPVSVVGALTHVIRSKGFLESGNQSNADILQSLIESIEWKDIPDCADLIVFDNRVMRSIKASLMTDNLSGPVYYMTRKDIHILTNMLFSPGNSNSVLQKDMYQYRAVMPYLFYSLLIIMDSLVTSKSVGIIPDSNNPRRVKADDIINPDNWSYSVYETISSAQAASEAKELGESTESLLHDYLIVPSYNSETKLNDQGASNFVNTLSYNNFVNIFYNIRVMGASSKYMFEDRRFDQGSDNAFVDTSSITGLPVPVINSDTFLRTYYSFMLLLREFFSKGAA